MYTLDEFYRDKYSLFNRTFTCKHCRALVGKKFRQENPKYYRRYLIENRERALAGSRRWTRNNPDKIALYRQNKTINRQLAVASSHADDAAYLKQINEDSTCVITGLTVSTNLDHIMPVAVGRWGNNKGNLMWLYKNLNLSKGSSNVFEWVAEMEQERLDYLLPESVTMSVESFRHRMQLVLTEKAGELGMTLEQYTDFYNQEYYRKDSGDGNLL